jgi:hypothetical protein
MVSFIIISLKKKKQDTFNKKKINKNNPKTCKNQE